MYGQNSLHHNSNSIISAPQQTPSNAAAGKSASDVQPEPSVTMTEENKSTEISEPLKEEASDTKEIMATAEQIEVSDYRLYHKIISHLGPIYFKLFNYFL